MGNENKNCAIDFLKSDFEQCFQQMRHYDNQIFNICKFAFMVYSSFFAVAIGLYKFGIEKGLDLSLIATSILLTGFVVGVMIFCQVIRNRIYCVQVVRYINEIREKFLQNKPLAFENNVQMYINWRKPAFCNLASSQLWISYLIAFLNATLLGTFLYMYIGDGRAKVLIIACSTVLFLGMQVIGGILYLKAIDNKFGKK